MISRAPCSHSSVFGVSVFFSYAGSQICDATEYLIAGFLLSFEGFPYLKDLILGHPEEPLS
jgi:hypothetical protein